MPEFKEISPDDPTVTVFRGDICRYELTESLTFSEAVRRVMDVEDAFGTGPRDAVVEAAVQLQLDRFMAEFEN